MENIERVVRALGCDHVTFKANDEVIKKTMLESLRRRGDYCWFCHTGVVATPFKVALMYKVPLLVWGEPGSEQSGGYYNYKTKTPPDERWFNRQINLSINAEDMHGFIDGVEMRDLEPFQLPPCLGHPGLARIPLLPPTADRKTLFIGAPARRDYGHSLGYTEATSWALAKQVQKKRPDLISDLAYAPHPEEAGPPDAETPCRRYDFGVLESDYGQVLGMFSTPLIEAFLAGRRAVSVQPDALGTDMPK